MAKKKVEKKTKTAAQVKSYQVLIEPVVTEKTSSQGEAGRRVVFRVDPRATKPAIKQAVEQVYGVNVEAVRTANYLGKKKRVTGHIGTRAQTKKAYVTLRSGQTIDLVEGV